MVSVYSTELDFFFSEENRMKLAAETECLPCNLEQNKGQIAGRRNGDSHNQNTEYLPLRTCSEPERNTLGRGQAQPRLCPLWSDTLGPQLCVHLAGVWKDRGALPSPIRALCTLYLASKWDDGRRLRLVL